MNDSEQVTPHPPIQFGLGKLMQFVMVAALWCGAVTAPRAASSIISGCTASST